MLPLLTVHSDTVWCSLLFCTLNVCLAGMPYCLATYSNTAGEKGRFDLEQPCVVFTLRVLITSVGKHYPQVLICWFQTVGIILTPWMNDHTAIVIWMTWFISVLEVEKYLDLECTVFSWYILQALCSKCTLKDKIWMWLDCSRDSTRQ